MSDILRPCGLKPARFLCPWDYPGKNTGVGLPFPSPRDLPDSGIELRCPALQADSLVSEPPNKSMNTGLGSLSLLQGNFLTQELNQGLLNCRGILYQLSYRGSPKHNLKASAYSKGRTCMGRICDNIKILF